MQNKKNSNFWLEYEIIYLTKTPVAFIVLYNTTIVCKMQIFFKRKNDKIFEKD